ncbi:MAG: hypothetical protein HOO06_13070 [Bdellovibrionaceae bacterium]|jgi:hypothetical protein|nr:hypothetical protein [Pseudobdellovibrionaceae bacterium]
MKVLFIILSFLYFSNTWATKVQEGADFGFVKVSAETTSADFLSDGSGEILIIDAELSWGKSPKVSFDSENISKCKLESINIHKVNTQTMNYWIKIIATENTDFGGCEIIINQYGKEYKVQYNFWTS